MSFGLSKGGNNCRSLFWRLDIFMRLLAHWHSLGVFWWRVNLPPHHENRPRLPDLERSTLHDPMIEANYLSCLSYASPHSFLVYSNSLEQNSQSSVQILRTWSQGLQYHALTVGTAKADCYPVLSLVKKKARSTMSKSPMFDGRHYRFPSDLREHNHALTYRFCHKVL